jgi:hypothetical protein
MVGAHRDVSCLGNPQVLGWYPGSGRSPPPCLLIKQPTCGSTYSPKPSSAGCHHSQNWLPNKAHVLSGPADSSESTAAVCCHRGSPGTPTLLIFWQVHEVTWHLGRHPPSRVDPSHALVVGVAVVCLLKDAQTIVAKQLCR